jgi:hypothetical protein
MRRKCLNHPDIFCYVCGELTFKSQRRNFTPLIKKCYELYFGCKVSDQDNYWAPHICCVTCVRLLTGWINGSRHMPFAVPMVWREPKDHSSDCYFCLTNITGITSKSRHTVKYQNVPSAMRPVRLNEALPIPKPAANVIVDGEDSATDEADFRAGWRSL